MVSRFEVSAGTESRIVVSAGAVSLIVVSIAVESVSEPVVCVEPQAVITVPANNRAKIIFNFITWF